MGGEISGIPVVTGPGAPNDAVILIDPTSIAFAEDTLSLSAGQQGTLEMVDSSPTGVAHLSLWQNRPNPIESRGALQLGAGKGWLRGSADATWAVRKDP